MSKQKSIKLPLTAIEKEYWKKHKLHFCDIENFAADEWQVLFHCTEERARALKAMYLFQTIPSIGIRFAEDLVFMGYYSLQDLENTNGAELLDAYEQKKGFRVDPCVEDQFRLIVHVAQTGDRNRKWWDFTTIRKQFRQEHGYPINRPTK